MVTYDRQVKTANRLIAKYGQSVTVTQIPQIIADPSKPWETTDGTPVITTVKMIFFSPTATGDSQLGKEILQYLKGMDVAFGQIRGYLGASALVPKISDIVTRDSKVLKIKAVDTLAPNGQAIFHVLEFEL